jgi:hypothetical protein
MTPGTVVTLPPSAPARANAKPKPRTGIVRSAPWEFPGYVLVEKCDRPGLWWVNVKVIEGQSDE